ncbi:MAG: hypothetical protein OHK0052_27280 [Anaerolineales bacterium]
MAQKTFFGRLRSLTRLVVGGALLGLERLQNNLDDWEQDPLVVDETRPRDAASLAALPDSRKPPLNPLGDAAPLPKERAALVGLLFEVEDHLQDSLAFGSRMLNLVGRVVQPLARPALENKWINRLAARGEAEVARWQARGSLESAAGKQLAQTALENTVDAYIVSLTNNPEVRELVQTQSTSLANEAIEEVRERAVSADKLLEGMLRSLLRRTPRKFLPPPPVEVRESATKLRPPVEG